MHPTRSRATRSRVTAKRRLRDISCITSRERTPPAIYPAGEMHPPNYSRLRQEPSLNLLRTQIRISRRIGRLVSMFDLSAMGG
jgi:hypothetical protein